MKELLFGVFIIFGVIMSLISIYYVIGYVYIFILNTLTKIPFAKQWRRISYTSRNVRFYGNEGSFKLLFVIVFLVLSYMIGFLFLL